MSFVYINVSVCVEGIQQAVLSPNLCFTLVSSVHYLQFVRYNHYTDIFC